MGWATGTRRYAIAVVAAQADVAPGVTLREITMNGVANMASVGLVGKRTATGTKTDTPTTEVPQTINVVTSQQIEMTSATDLNLGGSQWKASASRHDVNTIQFANVPLSRGLMKFEPGSEPICKLYWNKKVLDDKNDLRRNA